MKKSLLFILAALCVPAVQAASVGWSVWSATATPTIASIKDSAYKQICLSTIAYTADDIGNTSGGSANTLTAGQTYYVSNLAFAIASSGQWNNANKTVGLKVYDENGKLLATSSDTEYQFNGGTGNKAFPNADTNTKGLSLLTSRMYLLQRLRTRLHLNSLIWKTVVCMQTQLQLFAEMVRA